MVPSITSPLLVLVFVGSFILYSHADGPGATKPRSERLLPQTLKLTQFPVTELRKEALAGRAFAHTLPGAQRRSGWCTQAEASPAQSSVTEPKEGSALEWHGGAKWGSQGQYSSPWAVLRDRGKS